MSALLMICERCPRVANGAAGLACSMSGRPAVEHAVAGDCPWGVFTAETAARAARLAEWSGADVAGRVEGGVGTELAGVLVDLGVVAPGGCGCAARAAEMDRNGLAWCQEHVPLISGWLVEGGRRAGFDCNAEMAGAVVAEAILRFKGRVRTAGDGRSTTG